MLFQSTHPHGVRQSFSKRPDCAAYVSIHAPARGATLAIDICIGIPIVSIHAPARGATKPSLYALRRGLVSIHAPARGATSHRGLGNIRPTSFNPRTRTGCDMLNPSWVPHCRTVSIHAPARGATPDDVVEEYGISFQSTHPHGVRPAMIMFSAPGTAFQSTHPHGVRHKAARCE